MADEKRPTELEMLVLRNLEAGRDFTHGLSNDDSVPAMFQCVLNGWVSRNHLTDKGRAVLAPVKGTYEITVVKKEKPPIALPPIGGWKN